VDKFCGFPLLAVALRNLFIWLLAAFGNSSMTELAAFEIYLNQYEVSWRKPASFIKNWNNS
jgi:hypothetical protein